MAKDPRTVSLAGAERDSNGDIIVWEKKGGEYVSRSAAGVDAREMIAQEAAFLEKPKGESQVGYTGPSKATKATKATKASPKS